jgi:signal transduction histidine kinase
MKLSDFIAANMESILREWEAYARTIPAAESMDMTALRDEAEAILHRIARDMARPQNAAQQEAKSKGRGPAPEEDTAAQLHAGGREAEGFSLNEMVSEYRALRASVIRLWTREMTTAERPALNEMVRFNEALDQALTESIARYSERVDHARELFLGVLGHDLRGPLGALLSSADYLLLSDGLTGSQIKAASLILRSGRRLRDMVSDLLDVARTRLGQSLPLEPGAMDLSSACRETVEEAQAHHPDHAVVFRADGNLSGTWDGARLRQLLSNLLENAVRHGAASRPVTVAARGAADQVALAVHNEGPPIPAYEQARIFEPLVSADNAQAEGSRAGLGLGLYISCTIARAHGGSIDVQSSERAGTTFTVRLPRHAGRRR